MSSITERRYFSIDAVELRLLESDAGKQLSWFPALFNSLSEDLGGFKETIKPSAFNRTIANGADVRALFNHNPDYVLGRNTAGTLDLSVTRKGLRSVVNPPDTQWANDLMVSIERGDISGGSFGFRVVKQDWNWNPDEEGLARREIQEVQLFDVSIVTYPAYPETNGSIGFRSLMDAIGIAPERFTLLLAKRQSGQPLDDEDRSELQEIISSLSPEPPAAPAEEDDEHSAGYRDHLRYRLELMRLATPMRGH